MNRYLLPEKDLFNQYKYEEREISEQDIRQSLLVHHEADTTLSVNN